MLANVLKNSEYAEHRAAATEIIAYYGNKQKAVEYFLYAVDDPDEEVRNNAMRAIGIFGRLYVFAPWVKN